MFVGGMQGGNPSKNNTTRVKTEVNEMLGEMFGELLGLEALELQYTFKYNNNDYPIEVAQKEGNDYDLYTTFYEYK